ncbi:unnamed protein product [Ectocarpus sp. 8 AP-2014]
MRALKWAAGIALGIDPEDSPGFRGGNRGRTESYSHIYDDDGPSFTSNTGRPRAGTTAGDSQTVSAARGAARGGGGGGNGRRGSRSGWMDDDSSPSCLLCDALFTFTNRRHHCRACLKLVCSACSSNMWKLEAGRSRGYGSAGRRAAFKRVCDKCYGTLVATKEVLVGGDAASLDSGEHVHFEVIVHETLGRAQASRGDAPPSVPVGPSSPRAGAATTGFGVGFSGRATWGEGDDAAAGGGGGAAPTPSAEAAPRLLGSDVLNRARAPYCRLTVASKQVKVEGSK